MMRFLGPILIPFLIVACRSGAYEGAGDEETAAAAMFDDHGFFDGNVDGRWRDDDRTMELLADFAYVDSNGKRWDAPEGSVVDGASIPRKLWSLVGAPFAGNYRKASVVHDVACQERKERWQDVHLMFYRACRCGGVGRIKAKVMYWAVYQLGPSWEPGGAFTPALQSLDPVQEGRFDEIVEYIEQNDPQLDELESLTIR